MQSKVVLTALALAVLAGGAATAATRHGETEASKYALPAQPIAYGKLNAYLKATPRQRASRSWSNPPMANTGAAANTSATAPAAAPVNTVAPTALPANPAAWRQPMTPPNSSIFSPPQNPDQTGQSTQPPAGVLPQTTPEPNPPPSGAQQQPQ